MAAIFLSLSVILALPPPGPPPDPSKGETYDGRAPEREPMGRRLALALPRAALTPPRAAVHLLQAPIHRMIRVFSREERDVDPRPRRYGWSITGAADIPALGARVWARDLLGPDMATTQALFMTGGTSFQLAKIEVDPNRDRPLGPTFTILGRNRVNEPYYGVAPETPADATDDDLSQRIHVAFLEARAGLRIRPGGAVGRWRLTLAMGGVVRRFSEAEKRPAMLETVPGGDGASFVRGQVGVEYLGAWDPSRSRPAIEVALTAEPAFGLGRDHSEWVTTRLETAVGAPLGEGTSLLFRVRLADQASFGPEAVNFWDVPEVGGDIHRGFNDGRFRGPTTAVAALDVRWPIKLRVDGFTFFEYGGAFGEHFDEFGPARMRPGIGTGIRIYSASGFLLRTYVAWGIGDGPRLALSFDARP